MEAVVALLAVVVLLAIAVFAVPAIICQAVAARLGSPIGVVLSGLAGLAVLVIFAWQGWAGCSADPAWVQREDSVEGGYYDHPCDGPTGMIIRVFLVLGSPLAALSMLATTVLTHRRVGRRPS